MDLESAIKVEGAAPDSHFRLRPCPRCQSDNVAYVQYVLGRRQEPWKVRCFDCGHTVDRQAILKHEAQVAWNKDGGRESRPFNNERYNPCKDCPDRYPACSDYCKKPEHLAWRVEQEKIRENQKKYQYPIWKHGERDSRKR